MNGRRAKALRKKVYGEDFSPRERRYDRSTEGQVLADTRRQLYQQLKKNWKRNA